MTSEMYQCGCWFQYSAGDAHVVAFHLCDRHALDVRVQLSSLSAVPQVILADLRESMEPGQVVIASTAGPIDEWCTIAVQGKRM